MCSSFDSSVVRTTWGITEKIQVKSKSLWPNLLEFAENSKVKKLFGKEYES